MKKMKHSKIKNTGILFELLSRQITADLIEGKESKALPLLRNYFKSGTALNKEYVLYQTLLKEKYSNENKTKDFIGLVVDTRKKISEAKLKREKYELIRDIKSNYDIESFFNNKIGNYKVLASIHKLFESCNTDTVNPAELITSKYTLVEHICSKPAANKTTRSEVVDAFATQSKEVRLLAYKILLEKFNSKYSNLGNREKKLLREYINNVGNTDKLKGYVDTELNSISTKISSKIKKVTDASTKIKLTESVHILDKMKSTKRIGENHILTILNYYKLVDELNNI